MADATDLKSVGLNRPVWVRVPPSAGAGWEPALRREAPSVASESREAGHWIKVNPAEPEWRFAEENYKIDFT